MRGSKAGLVRFVIFLLVAVLHSILLLFFVINIEAAVKEPEVPIMVMKLTDIQEEEPPPPPPPSEEEPPPLQNAVEAVAETMIETEVVPEQIITAAPIRPERVETEAIDYLPMYKISTPPSFSEREIRQALVYPPIARRSGIEGMVYLELFVDREGLVRNITILKEDPPDRGFAEAAVKAFQGRRGTPAQANGVPVAVRYRYPVRFAIRN
jgi:protein TonB